MSVGFSLCAFLSSAILVNPSFDEDKTGDCGWVLSSAHFSLARGYGLNGNGGLCFSSSAPVTIDATASQTLKLEVGKQYNFSAVVRCEDFSSSNKGFGIRVQYFDANQRWICEDGIIGMYLSGDSDWRVFTGSTRPVPDTCAAAKFLILAKKGSMGKVYVDNVIFEPLERDPVQFVFSSSYRNVAVDGDVRFYAALNTSGNVRTKAVFSFQDAEGRLQSREAYRPDDGSAFLDLSVNELKKGQSLVRCALLDEFGNTLGDAGCQFVRLERLPARRVWIDRQGRWIVDGHPFFPLGMYDQRCSGKVLEHYATGPFNVVMPYVRVSREDMNELQKKGIMAFCRMPKVQGVAHVEMQYREIVRDLRDHPALLGWYVNDEGPVSEVPIRTSLQRNVFNVDDTNHPTWAVFERTYDLRSFIPTCDVLGIDPYPIAQEHCSKVAEVMAAASKAVMRGRSFLNVPQAFNWAWFPRHRLNKGIDQRFPTEREMSNMVWQHIALGANGLVAYCHHWLYLPGRCPPEERDRCWEVICHVFGEVKRRTPLLLSDDANLPIRGDDALLLVRAWRKDGGIHILIVNASDENRKARFSVGEFAYDLALSPLEWRILESR